MNITLKKISEKFNVEFIGDGSYEINHVSSIANANENSIIFLSDKNFLKFLLRKWLKPILMEIMDMSREVSNSSKT